VDDFHHSAPRYLPGHRHGATQEAKISCPIRDWKCREEAVQVGELVMPPQIHSPSCLGQRCLLGAQHCAAEHVACMSCMVGDRERAGCSPTSANWPAPDLPVSLLLKYLKGHVEFRLLVLQKSGLKAVP